jgi:hypothetical protein
MADEKMLTFKRLGTAQGGCGIRTFCHFNKLAGGLETAFLIFDVDLVRMQLLGGNSESLLNLGHGCVGLEIEQLVVVGHTAHRKRGIECERAEAAHHKQKEQQQYELGRKCLARHLTSQILPPR